MNLSNTLLFRGLEDTEITFLLNCLDATERSYKKSEVLLSEGSITENIGIVLSGMAVIFCNDIWGNTSILGNVAPGSVFAEVYACVPGQPMLGERIRCGGYVRPVRECGPCLGHLYQFLPVPYTACPKFADYLRPQKPPAFPKDPAYHLQIHSGKADVLFFGMCQTLREQLVSYPVQPASSWQDYLNVDRALCNELSKMQNDGVIEYERNRILLKA